MITWSEEESCNDTLKEAWYARSKGNSNIGTLYQRQVYNEPGTPDVWWLLNLGSVIGGPYHGIAAAKIAVQMMFD